MRQEQKYAVSNVEIMVDLMQRVNFNPNPVTICTLKNILKGRLKRGDEDALKHYIKYCAFRVFMTGKHKLTDEQVKEKLTDIFNNYMSEIDTKKRDMNTAFEDFENEYYY